MSSKLWFRAGTIAFLSLALSTTIAIAQDYDHGERHDRDEREHDREWDRDHGHEYGYEHGRVHDRYDDHDRDQIRGWYRAHHDHLPPGFAMRDRLSPELERQLVVNGPLPVVLRGRMHPCPHELEVMLPPAPPNYAHVVIGGNVVLMNRASFQVADVVHLDVHF